MRTVFFFLIQFILGSTSAADVTNNTINNNTPINNDNINDIDKKLDTISVIFDKFLNSNLLIKNTETPLKITLLNDQIASFLKTAQNDKLIKILFIWIRHHFRQLNLNEEIKNKAVMKIEEIVNSLHEMSIQLKKVMETSPDVNLKKGVFSNKLKETFLCDIFYLCVISRCGVLSKSSIIKSDLTPEEYYIKLDEVETTVNAFLKIEYALKVLSLFLHMVYRWDLEKEGFIFYDFVETLDSGNFLDKGNFYKNKPIIGTANKISEYIKREDERFQLNIRNFIKNYKGSYPYKMDDLIEYVIIGLYLLQQKKSTLKNETESIVRISKMIEDGWIMRGNIDKLRKLGGLIVKMQNLLGFSEYQETPQEILKKSKESTDFIEKYEFTKKMLFYGGGFLILLNVLLFGWNNVIKEIMRF